MIRIEDLSYTYPGRSVPTIKDLSIEIAKGEFVLLTGPTGCGKSTLLKIMNGLIPCLIGGTLNGRVIIDGVNTCKVSLSYLSQKVGLIFQSPDDQIFATCVQDEVAFGPENLALDPAVIRERVEQSLRSVGLTGFLHRSTRHLSGGQKQRLAIASVLAMEPDILLLDEPFAQLDPRGRVEVLEVIKALNAQGMTVILVEHRIHDVAHSVDRIVVMDRGQIVLNDEPRLAFERAEQFKNLGLRVPDGVEFSHAMKFKNVALSLQEIEVEIDRIEKDPCSAAKRTSLTIPLQKPKAERPILEMEGVCFRYHKKEDFVLKGVSLTVEKGEVVSLMGNNGSGKSTLLLHFAGLLKPERGRVVVLGENGHKVHSRRLAGRTGVVLQNPALMLFNGTVYEEVAFGPRALRFQKGEQEQSIEESLHAMGIVELAKENPLALSGGQRLRVALASVISMRPEVILLDEPTSGQDKCNIDALLEYLRSLAQKGVTVIFTTHDMDTSLRYSDRLLIMNNGQIIADGKPHEVVQNTDVLESANLKPPLCFEIGQMLGFDAFCAQDLVRWAVSNS